MQNSFLKKIDEGTERKEKRDRTQANKHYLNNLEHAFLKTQKAKNKKTKPYQCHLPEFPVSVFKCLISHSVPIQT